MTAQTATGHITQDAEAVPAKPEHKISQLTTGELARERARLEAALCRPFAAEIKRLLRSRLDAVQDEQAQRARRRDEDVAAAKAELAAQSAARAAADNPVSVRPRPRQVAGTPGGPRAPDTTRRPPGGLPS